MQKIPQIVIEARARLLTKAVFFASILYERCKLVVVDDDNPMFDGTNCPTAMTDGRNIIINASFFARKNLDERVFVFAHEVYHAMAMHPKRMKRYAAEGLCGYPFSARLYNIAADAVINVCLRDSQIGSIPEDAVLIPPEKLGGYQITGMELPETIYEMLIDNNPDIKNQLQQASEAGSGYGGTDPRDGSTGDKQLDDLSGNGMGGDLIQPNAEAETQISENEMRSAIQSAAAAAKAQGTMPGKLKAFIDDFLEPQVSWEEHLRTAFVAVAGRDRADWSRANRRKLVSPGVYMPRRRGTRTGPLVIAIDTSGSVSERDLKAFLSEVFAILSDVRPEKITIVWCDAQVDRVDVLDEPEELVELTRAEGIPGRGGTSFIPPFEYVAENDIDCETFIYLTDGYGPFPTEELAPYPTIWCFNTDVPAPFGEAVRIKV